MSAILSGLLSRFLRCLGQKSIYILQIKYGQSENKDTSQIDGPQKSQLDIKLVHQTV